MKEMLNIADRGGKHHDPVHGPPEIRVHRLEEVGKTVRGDELMREAERPEEFSRAGATPACAAFQPPQTGVAPALEELPLVMRIP